MDLNLPEKQLFWTLTSILNFSVTQWLILATWILFTKFEGGSQFIRQCVLEHPKVDWPYSGVSYYRDTNFQLIEMLEISFIYRWGNRDSAEVTCLRPQSFPKACVQNRLQISWFLISFSLPEWPLGRTSCWAAAWAVESPLCLPSLHTGAWPYGQKIYLLSFLHHLPASSLEPTTYIHIVACKILYKYFVNHTVLYK